MCLLFLIKYIQYTLSLCASFILPHLSLWLYIYIYVAIIYIYIGNLLFNALDVSQMDVVVAAMERVEFKQDDTIITLVF